MNVRGIVDLFGGQTALAELIGKGQSTVAYWVKVGSIPSKWHSKLLMLATENGVNLSAHDLIESSQIELNADVSTNEDIRINNGNLDNIQHEIFKEKSPFVFYESDNGAIKVQVLLGDETIWASQQGMADIFDIESNTVTYHLGNIFSSNELTEESVARNIRVTASDNKNYNVKFYNLDAIISVGYRVNSYKATQFRKWATTVLKEYLIKGFAINDDRLKQGNQLLARTILMSCLRRSGKLGRQRGDSIKKLRIYMLNAALIMIKILPLHRNSMRMFKTNCIMQFMGTHQVRLSN